VQDSFDAWLEDCATKAKESRVGTRLEYFPKGSITRQQVTRVFRQRDEPLFPYSPPLSLFDPDVATDTRDTAGRGMSR
jgi:hypothetical protein